MTPSSLAPPPAETHRSAPDPVRIRRRAGPVISTPFLSDAPSRRLLGRPLWLSAAAHLLLIPALALVLRVGPRFPVAPMPDAPAPVQYIDLAFPSSGAAGGGGAAVDAPVAPGAATGPSAPVAGPRRGGEAGAPRFPGRAPAATGGGAPAGGAGGAGEGGAAPAGGGGGGVAERLRPGFRDPRLYVNPSLPSIPPRGVQSDNQRYAEHLQRRIDAMNDSIHGATPRPNTDWTVKDGEGRRWGLSEDGLHLGGLTIPKELLPIPGRTGTGTNADQAEERERQRQRDEIQRQELDRERREAKRQSEEAARARREQERQKGGGSDG